ncbi:unnamed protein product [Nezara viridula]|uniref:alpha-glucosidase n=1 Tax=Nezara viridula TaxID=85310 RepID=A0A9P0MRX4_NEZVI|nr:unnamed protein product [Nezara viridula]
MDNDLQDGQVLEMMLLPILVGLLHLASAELPWWKTSIMYQVYVRSFADSDGDGNGDLRGVIGKVPYLKDIGVGIIWLSPVFSSPWKDMGYDIDDFLKVQPLFGTNQDLEELIKVVHDYGMKIFLDFVPNHTSEEHAWFNASRNRQDGKDDYYVWYDPSGYKDGVPQPPNGWKSIFGGDSWTYDETRKQFYLHQFGPFQPELNFTNQKVIDDMKDIMRYWLDKGLDGWRMDAVPFLVEDKQLREEPYIPNCTRKIPGTCMYHIWTQNQPETYEVMKEFDELLLEYENTNPKHLFLEAYANASQVMAYYQEHSTPFNFDLVTAMKQDTNATTLRRIVDGYMNNLPNGGWPNWVTGNHDNLRVGTKLGPEMVDPMLMLQLMLPGVSVTYQGEEIGMKDTFLRDDLKVDVTGDDRDAERSPMQWNKRRNAGFSRARKTWLPVNPNYYQLNVQNQQVDPSSHLRLYKRLAKVKKEFSDSIELETATYGDWVFAFKRTNKNKVYYVVINLDNYEQSVPLSKLFKNVPDILHVHTTSINSHYKINNILRKGSKVKLYPRSSIGLFSTTV